MKTKDYILVGLVLIALAGVFYFGWTMHSKYNPCPVITSDTVYVYDTITHVIPDTIPYMVVKYDSIVYRDTVFKDVDTATILRDYFAEHYYTRHWNDTLISVTQHDVITENKFKDSDFTYKLLKPVTVIKNVVNNTFYNRYVTIGAGVSLKDIKHVDLEVDYVTKNWYGGIGYDAGLNFVSIKGGVTIMRIR